jgi:hypothetical protein
VERSNCYGLRAISAGRTPLRIHGADRVETVPSPKLGQQMLDALSRTHLWADRFDGSLEDVFARRSGVNPDQGRLIGAWLPSPPHRDPSRRCAGAEPFFR